MTRKHILSVAFVTPRYLQNHAGGAENLCRLTAEKCASLGHYVEILTTCAVNTHTWENVEPSGCCLINGVIIRRFRADERPDVDRFHEIERKMSLHETLSDDEEAIWLRNGLNSAELYRYLKENQSQYDAVVFLPYLFPLSIIGSRFCPEKFFLTPCLHDEPFARLKCVKEMFQRAKGILFNAPPEYELARNLYDLNDDNCHLVSLGFSPPAHAINPRNFRKKFHITKPYITFAGRREEGKNFFLLLSMFRAINKTYPNKFQFVTFGSGDCQLQMTDQGHVFDLGFLSEEDKFNALSGALFNCQPSLNESLSISVMESWIVKRPMLVHQNCAVTSFWINQSGGGLTFANFFEFEQALIYGLTHPDEMQVMGENGHFFLTENFKWSDILDRFVSAIQYDKESLLTHKTSE